MLKATVNISFLNSAHYVQIKSTDSDSAYQVGEATVLYIDCHSVKIEMLGVGESTLDVGEQTVGETTRRQNDRNSCT